MFYLMIDYRFKGFRISHAKHSKYDAILVHKQIGNTIFLPFGGATTKTYQDLTGLNAFPSLLHHDANVRKLYHKRNDKRLRHGYFSPTYFSLKYLF